MCFLIFYQINARLTRYHTTALPVINIAAIGTATTIVKWIEKCHYKIDDHGAIKQNVTPQGHEAANPKQR